MKHSASTARSLGVPYQAALAGSCSQRTPGPIAHMNAVDMVVHQGCFTPHHASVPAHTCVYKHSENCLGPPWGLPCSSLMLAEVELKHQPCKPNKGRQQATAKASSTSHTHTLSHSLQVPGQCVNTHIYIYIYAAGCGTPSGITCIYNYIYHGDAGIALFANPPIIYRLTKTIPLYI